MSSAAQDLLDEGRQAIAAGKWTAARDAFTAALDQEESGDALFGLGVAEWWQGETDLSLRCWERAYGASRRQGQAEGAVFAAVYLCLAYQMSLGNDAAARGWLGRATSLVEDLGLAPMMGWVLLCRAYIANDAGEPRAAEGWAREAREIAREGGDADLELCALSELGAALCGTGRTDEGLAMLDEAMAGALAGEGGDLDTVVLIGCRTVTCCSRTLDVRRAVQWISAADDFNRRYGSSHLYTTCRTHYGAILFAAGDWERAEAELKRALEIGRTAEPVLHAQALGKLAELRIAQGRSEEAARLLEGYEDRPATGSSAAALALERGEPQAASSLLRRRLREVAGESPEGAQLIELLSEAAIQQGRAADALAHAGGLARIASSDLARAFAQRGLGRALLETGDPAAAEALESAFAAFTSLEMPFEAGRARLLLARALAESERETAIAEGRAALACFERLGAARDADAAAGFLRSLGVKSARSGPKGIGLLTKRESEILRLLGEGLSNPEIAARLFLSRKTVEHHVSSVLSKLDLASRGEATAYAVRHLHRDPAGE